MSNAFSALLALMLTGLGKFKALGIGRAFRRPTAEELALALTLALARALALTGPLAETARVFALGALWPTAGFASHHDEPLRLTLRT